jgi:tellurite resistance protein TerA
MESANAIILGRKGESAPISLDQKSLSTIHVRLKWTKAVDLDLHAFYKSKAGEIGHVFYQNMGNLEAEPYILLDQDAGVGNVPGNNEENLRIRNLHRFDSIMIATNIFRILHFLHSGDNFARYDGKVIVRSDSGDHIEVPLISEELGRWCVIAEIDNTGSRPSVVNINRVQKEEPGYRFV